MLPRRTRTLSLVQQAQHGDLNALSRLAILVRPQISSYIHRHVHDEHTAEDLTQETLLALIRYLRRIHISQESAFWAWVYRTALSKVQDHGRRRGNGRVYHQTQFGYPDLESLVSYKTSIPKAAMLNERKVVLAQAMQGLKPTHRLVLIRHCFYHLTFREIATIDGGTEVQARLLFFRAKQALKKELSHQGFGKSDLMLGLSALAAVVFKSTKKPITEASTAGNASAFFSSIVSNLCHHPLHSRRCAHLCWCGLLSNRNQPRTRF